MITGYCVTRVMELRLSGSFETKIDKSQSFYDNLDNLNAQYVGATNISVDSGCHCVSEHFL